MTIARIADGSMAERRDITLADVPEHKRALWRLIEYVGEGPLEGVSVEADRVVIIRSFPAPTATSVRNEAQRRIIALTGASDLTSCIIKQLNALMRVGEINDKQARGETLSEQEQTEAVSLRAMANAVKAIRAASNAMEGNPPADYADDGRWP